MKKVIILDYCTLAIDEERQPVGTSTVAKVWEKTGIAIVTENCPVKPGWMVTWKNL